MFKFLKNIIGDQEKATAIDDDIDAGVVLIALRNKTLVFETSAIYPQRELELAMRLREADGRKKWRRVKVNLRECRLIGGAVREYVGDLDNDSPDARRFVKAVIANHDRLRREKAHLRGELRKGKRMALKFQVMSRDIKNYKGISGDVSLTGIKIFVEEALPVGKNIDLLLNFDDQRFPRVNCRADVIWCRATDRDYAVGLRFSGLAEAHKNTIEGYLQFTQDYRDRMRRAGHVTLSDDERE